MECNHCGRKCNKAGFQRKTGTQKYRCTECGKYQQQDYKYKAYRLGTDQRIVGLTLESCGIRSTGRLLDISSKTVVSRIVKIASNIQKPTIKMGRVYEVDEMRTFVGRKKKKRWLTYALDTISKEVVDFRIGGRGIKSMGQVCQTLLLSKASEIRTDGYCVYKSLIPIGIHKVSKHKTNHIERRNLDLRHSLKRLSRKTIAFAKSVHMLESILKIYFRYNRSEMSII